MYLIATPGSRVWSTYLLLGDATTESIMWHSKSSHARKGRLKENDLSTSVIYCRLASSFIYVLWVLMMTALALNLWHNCIISPFASLDKIICFSLVLSALAARHKDTFLVACSFHSYCFCIYRANSRLRNHVTPNKRLIHCYDVAWLVMVLIAFVALVECRIQPLLPNDLGLSGQQMSFIISTDVFHEFLNPSPWGFKTLLSWVFRVFLLQVLHIWHQLFSLSILQKHEDLLIADLKSILP